VGDRTHHRHEGKSAEHGLVVMEGSPTEATIILCARFMADMDIEDPTHQANRMLGAALLTRNELLDEGLDSREPRGPEATRIDGQC
jgi:hypothetical protein